MKKFILVVMLLVASAVTFGQHKMVADATLTASAAYVIPTQSDSGPWSIGVIPGTMSGTTTVALEVTHNGTKWVAYPTYVADTVQSDSVTMFYGQYNPFTLMRVSFTVGTAAIAPIRVYYTSKD